MEDRIIRLLSLELRNFKGAKELKIDFNPDGPTNIYADNGKFKTTVADAINWVMFGKNSNDEEKFGIKTFDKDGKIIPNLRHSVIAKFEVNGVEEVFERRLSENWKREHGEVEKKFKNDQFLYFSNGESVKAGVFNTDISQLCESSMFKLLSNPLQFDRLEWKERRKILVDIVGEIPDLEILEQITTVKNKGDFNGLINTLNRKKSLERYRNGLMDQIKGHERELDEIPPRIDEVERLKPAYLDWNKIEADIKALKSELAQIDATIAEESKKHEKEQKKKTSITKSIGEKKLVVQNLESKLKLEANKLVNKNKTEASKIESYITDNELLINDSETTISIKNIDIAAFNSEIKNLREEYNFISSSKFELVPDSCICPTCKQDLPDIETKKEELEGNFNEDKANKLKAINKKGKAKVEKVELFETIIVDLKKDIDKSKKRIEDYNIQLEKLDVKENIIVFGKNAEWSKLNGEIHDLEIDLDKIKIITNQELIEKKEVVNNAIAKLNLDLKVKDQIIKADDRISELKQEQIDHSQKVAKFQKEIYALDKFEKVKMDRTEEKVNSMFSICKFRMFERQKNSIEKPECVTLIDGVPFSDANTASKINAGLDIIRVLSNHYGVFLPSIIDNRESVTNIIEMKSQVINLIKDENYQTLTVK